MRCNLKASIYILTFTRTTCCRDIQCGLMAIVTSKAKRGMLQSKANRGNPHIATAAELDFFYPPQCNILDTTTSAIDADAVWLKLAG